MPIHYTRQPSWAVKSGLFREVATICYRGRLQCVSTVLVLFGAREAGCFREVTVSYSDIIIVIWYSCRVHYSTV